MYLFPLSRHMTTPTRFRDTGLSPFTRPKIGGKVRSAPGVHRNCSNAVRVYTADQLDDQRKQDFATLIGLQDISITCASLTKGCNRQSRNLNPLCPTSECTTSFGRKLRRRASAKQPRDRVLEVLKDNRRALRRGCETVSSLSPVDGCWGMPSDILPCTSAGATSLLQPSHTGRQPRTLPLAFGGLILALKHH